VKFKGVANLCQELHHTRNVGYFSYNNKSRAVVENVRAGYRRVKKVKLSLYQAMKAHRVVRR
jgi:ribose 1,5-bisphosphokinase PhnN